MVEHECCCQCFEHTGRAGRGEDSLFTEEGDLGPYCQSCWDDVEYWRGLAGEMMQALRDKTEQ